ncbi:NAD(P)H-binding protein [Bradyrhizobium elkanii]|uniref:NmrA family NAD(P)-binding protein n=1 Tax=Bradyrhizobium elkanii TaxID=29448 RepID=UPI0022277806|nr:NAD(P)H-binding protein [Bradyrhizobium elkanii]MCW2109520.1 uncharacterized protein YbjT (DUF2867 family) [Bradyrhizobium elkanii]
MAYVVVGANGQTGSVAAQRLLDKGYSVRVIVRRSEQASDWSTRGATAFVADLGDPATMRGAFDGASGAYLMNPPAYGSPDIFATAHEVHSIMIREAERSGVAHVVALSSVGAQHESGTGNILTTHDLESQLASSRLRATVLRAANFVDNWLWSLPVVRETGLLPSMLHPVDKPLPMVAAADIGKVAADLLVRGASAPQLVELHGPRDYSPADAASTLSTLLGQSVRAVPTPESQWQQAFLANGFSQSAIDAFCEMYRGFNSGLVSFSGRGEVVEGSTRLKDVFESALSGPGPTAAPVEKN